MESADRPGRSSGFPAPSGSLPVSIFRNSGTQRPEGFPRLSAVGSDGYGSDNCEKPCIAVGKTNRTWREGRVTAAGPLPILTGFPIKLVHLDLSQIRNAAGSVKKNRFGPCCSDGRLKTVANRVCGAACRRCGHGRARAGEARCPERSFRFAGCRPNRPGRPENRFHGKR